MFVQPSQWSWLLYVSSALKGLTFVQEAEREVSEQQKKLQWIQMIYFPTI